MLLKIKDAGLDIKTHHLFTVNLIKNCLWMDMHEAYGHTDKMLCPCAVVAVTH